MSDTLVKVENVSKKFCRSLKRSLWYGVRDIGAELLGRSHNQNGPPPLRTDEFWAVQDVNFELKRGDCLGLIGRNGAGKSTLLKMLNGLLKPDTGRIEMRGRIGALIELGTGFNPILTGRENVYVNGSVLGFTKKEIDRKFEAIVEFAEIGDFIDMPVKNYSSGMKVRLGFAVAAQMEPDVLIIDEVLSVGDTGFRVKCHNAIQNLVKTSSVILVSHHMPEVARTATRIMLLNKGGALLQTDDVNKGVAAYNDLFPDLGEVEAVGNKDALLSASLQSAANRSENGVPIVNYLEGFMADLRLCLPADVEFFGLRLDMYDHKRQVVAQCYSKFFTELFLNPKQAFQISVQVPRLQFVEGLYSIDIAITTHSQHLNREEILARYQNALKFKMIGCPVIAFAPTVLEGQWSIHA